MEEIRIAASFRRFLEQKAGSSLVAERLLNPECVSLAFGNFLSIKNGMIGYMPAGKRQNILDDGTWSLVGRQHARAARVARKLLNKKGLEGLSDKDFEIFANLFAATAEDFTGTIQIVSGESIREWYRHSRYAAEKIGSLSDSCMRYDRCQPFLDIYAANKKIKLVILTNDDDQLVGRALLWETPDGNRYLDRIYGSDVTVEILRNKAIHNGWFYRKYNSYHDELWWIEPTEGCEVEKMVEVPLERWDFDYYPYMDTFKYLYEGSVRNYSGYGQIGELTSIEGAGNRNNVWSEHERRFIPRDDAIEVPNYGVVHIDDTAECDYCGNLFHISDITISVDGGAYCDSHLVRDHHGDIYGLEDVNNGRLIYLSDLSDYVLADDCLTCEECNDYFLEDDAITLTDRNGDDHVFCCNAHAEDFRNSNSSLFEQQDEEDEEDET